MITLFIKFNHFHYTFSSNRIVYIRMIKFSSVMNFHQYDEFLSEWWIFITVMNFHQNVTSIHLHINQSDECSLKWWNFLKLAVFIKVMNFIKLIIDFHQSGEFSSNWFKIFINMILITLINFHHINEFSLNCLISSSL